MNITCFTAGVRVDLTGVQEEVLQFLTWVAADLIVDAAGPPDVSVSDVELPLDADSEQAVARWLHALHLAALTHTPTLPIHAAAVAGPSGCLVLPGPSGMGKSTLAAAALQSGLTLLSDEVACFTDPPGTVLPHARPLKLARASRRLLGVSTGPADPDEEIALSPAVFGRAADPESRHRCRHLVVPVRTPGRRAALEPILPSVALATLGRCQLRADVRLWPPERTWAYLSEVVNSVEVATLVFDDPYDAADILVALLA